MNIQSAPNMLQYSDPVHWIRTKVLPEKRVCGGCESTLVLDHESDIYVTSSGGRPVLAYKCMVCGQECVIKRPTNEQIEQAKTWVDLTDEEYTEFRQNKIVERAKARRDYLYIGSDKWLPARYEWIDDKKYSSKEGEWERFVEEKYLPAVPPETRTTLTKIEVLYDDVLAYYQKKANAAQKVKQATSSVTTFPKKHLLLPLSVIIFVTALFMIASGVPSGIFMLAGGTFLFGFAITS